MPGMHLVFTSLCMEGNSPLVVSFPPFIPIFPLLHPMPINRLIQL